MSWLCRHRVAARIGQATLDVAARVLRIQQSVQRFAQRGKHRFLITNAGLLRWTQLRNAMSFGEAKCGVRMSMKQQLRHCCNTCRVAAERDRGERVPRALRIPRRNGKTPSAYAALLIRQQRISMIVSRSSSRRGIWL
ncbi:hypothetical protein HT746_00020 [Burkholderia pyrrocinia]|uniref:hypothetical protein n=1 Tax=Burkholderia pyrrocinia TaxID=60550 RepID=UPI001576469C|nr:hypothetical protein [Burkholderia pyrrocinia]NTX25555.1 hypothetical protein [Burkholderia pyrrocinia]